MKKLLPIEYLFKAATAKKSRGRGVTYALAQICKRRRDHSFLVVRNVAEAKRVNTEYDIKAIPVGQILKGVALADHFSAYIFDPDALIEVLGLMYKAHEQAMLEKDKEIKKLKEIIKNGSKHKE